MEILCICNGSRTQYAVERRTTSCSLVQENVQFSAGKCPSLGSVYTKLNAMQQTWCTNPGGIAISESKLVSDLGIDMSNNAFYQMNITKCRQVVTTQYCINGGKLESIQRSQTEKLASMPSISYWERLKGLKLFSFVRRRESCSVKRILKIVESIYNKRWRWMLHRRQNGTHITLPRMHTAPSKYRTRYCNNLIFQWFITFFNNLLKCLRDLHGMDTCVFKTKPDLFPSRVPSEPTS